MRRLVVACAFGLLLALPAPAGAAKVIDVPAEAVFRAGNTTQENCQAFVFVQWAEQENAQAWELDYEYLKGTSDILTHEKKALFPPFSDELKADRGWIPPAGTHWAYHTYRAESAAPEHTAECASLQAEMLGRVITATVHVTVPGDAEEDESEDDESDDGDSDGDDPAESSKEKEIDKPEDEVGVPKCLGATPTIFARPGTPTNGTARRDVILGTSGRDVIRSRGGNDLVCGLTGDDLILGGGGRDVLFGQGGRDTLRGQAGRDSLLGGGGADRLFGQAGADRLFGHAGADVLSGGSGRPDLCDGGPDRDQQQSPGCERRVDIP